METGLLRLRPWEECRDLSVFVEDLKKATALRTKLQNFNFQYLRDKLYTFDEIMKVDGLCWFIPRDITNLRPQIANYLENHWRDLLPIDQYNYNHRTTFSNYNILIPIFTEGDCFSIFRHPSAYSAITKYEKFLLSVLGYYGLDTKRLSISQVENLLKPGRLREIISNLAVYKSPILLSFLMIRAVFCIIERVLIHPLRERHDLEDTKNRVSEGIKRLLHEEIDLRIFIREDKDWHWIASDLTEEINDEVRRNNYYSVAKGLSLFWIDEYRCPWYAGDESHLKKSRVKVNKESGYISYNYINNTILGPGSVVLENKEGKKSFLTPSILGFDSEIRVGIDSNEIIRPTEKTYFGYEYRYK